MHVCTSEICLFETVFQLGLKANRLGKAGWPTESRDALVTLLPRFREYKVLQPCLAFHMGGRGETPVLMLEQQALRRLNYFSVPIQLLSL